MKDEYKIYLGWKNPDGRKEQDWYDDCFRQATPELFEKIVKDTEKMLLDAIKEYGSKEYIHIYSPYTFIRLHHNGKMIAGWSITKFLRKEGYHIS